ncbi:hypothetical protein BGZ46_001434 [Entomortierella lignicola]|nr:hypothetical protein BGZ46_001434 [Entomortierella lignicola]
MQEINAPHPRLGEDYNLETDFDLKWLRDSASRWFDLCQLKPDAFTTKGLTEYFWRSKVWRVTDELFNNVPNVIMVGGEA